MPPVGGVGALGVVGLRRAGVGLGGLRERRKAAAEASGGREQGRGVGAGSIGLERRAFRVSAIRAVPDASVRTALRVGLPVGVGGGAAAVGADGARRARTFDPAAAAAASSEALALARLPGMPCSAKRGEVAQLRRPPAAAAPASSDGQGRAPPPNPTPTGRSPSASAAPRASSQRYLREDLDGRTGPAPAAARRKAADPVAQAPGRGHGGQGAATRIPTPRRRRRRAPEPSLERPSEASGLDLAAFGMALRAGSQIMSDKAILSDIPAPRQAGRIDCAKQVTKRRRQFTMPK